jgi:hypothetical protein
LVGIFGVDRLEAVPLTSDLPTIESPHNTQIRYLISYLRTQRPRFLHLNICRQGVDQVNEMRFSNLLIEDANFDNSSYVDYLIQIHRYFKIFIIGRFKPKLARQIDIIKH